MGPRLNGHVFVRFYPVNPDELRLVTNQQVGETPQVCTSGQTARTCKKASRTSHFAQHLQRGLVAGRAYDGCAVHRRRGGYGSHARRAEPETRHVGSKRRRGRRRAHARESAPSGVPRGAFGARDAAREGDPRCAPTSARPQSARCARGAAARGRHGLRKHCAQKCQVPAPILGLGCGKYGRAKLRNRFAEADSTRWKP